MTLRTSWMYNFATVETLLWGLESVGAMVALGGHGAQACRCVMPGVEPPLIRWFEDVDWEKVLWQLAVATCELMTAKLLAATDMVKFHRLSKFFYIIVK